MSIEITPDIMTTLSQLLAEIQKANLLLQQIAINTTPKKGA